MEIKSFIDRAPKHIKDMVRDLFSLQFHNRRCKAHKNLIPKQVKLIMLRDSEPGQPTADGIDALSRTAAVVIEDIPDFRHFPFLEGLAIVAVDRNSAQWEQGTDSGFAVMHTAPAICSQQRAGAPRTVGKQVDNRDTGVAPNIGFGIGLDYPLHRHAFFLGNIVDVPGVENNCVLMDAALSTPAALKAELRVQVEQIVFQMLDSFAGLQHII
jgi:hypothetical protein